MKARTRSNTGSPANGKRLSLVKAEDGGVRTPAPPLTPEMKREVKTAATAEAAAKNLRKPECFMDRGDKLAYNVREAAAALGVSEWYIRDEIGKKMLAVTQARGRILIPRRELERYIDENMHEPSPAGETEAPEPHGGLKNKRMI